MWCNKSIIMSNQEKSKITKITNEMRKDLRGDFPDEAYKPHPTKTFLTTLKAMYVTERLNDVFGVGRWTVEHQVIERTDDYVLVSGQFKSLDYDVIVPVQFGGHKTTGRNTEIADGYKSAVTDCISKIASVLEIGIEMFKGNISPKINDKKTDKQEVQKPWLNIYVKDTKNLTDEMTAVSLKMKDGTYNSVSDIRQDYAVNKVNAATLEAWFLKLKKVA